jgi:hypothetical protein
MSGVTRSPIPAAVRWGVAILVTLIASECGSCVFFILRPMVENASSRPDNRELDGILARDGVSRDRLAREMGALYVDHVSFHPYRWFALPANYRGEYITTDNNGFRIDPRTIRPETAKIAFFGGSAMFSVRSRNEGTIPALFSGALNGGVVQALNFGIGGYSSTAELTTFIEAVRVYDHITTAIFYDGYNEVARYVERLQEHAANSYYDVLGYPYDAGLRPAMDAFIAGHETKVSYRPQTIRLISGLLSRTRGTRNIDVLLPDADIPRHAEAIVDVYLKNVRDIAAIAQQHQVTAVFFWQPDIGSTTRKPFTDTERLIKASDPVVRKLSAAVRAALVRKPELATYHWFDLSEAFDELDGRPHFLDPVHVSVDANRLIAAKMERVLHGSVPANYWRK